MTRSRFPGLGPVLAIGAFAVALVSLTGCEWPGGDTNYTCNQTQIVKVVTNPPPPLVDGCTGVALAGIPEGADAVRLDIEPATGTYRLLLDGTDVGTAYDGQLVRLRSGTHRLQVTAGACSSNTLDVVIP